MSPAMKAGAPHTLEDFMAQALVMEQDAVARYTEFADMMETHNNPEVAEWFRKMAVIEGKHATQIMAEMGWTEAPKHIATLAVIDGFEGMEGNGPVGGTPIDHRVCVASPDWLAADRVAVELMGIDYAKVGYLNFCANAGLGQGLDLARPFQPAGYRC